MINKNELKRITDYMIDFFPDYIKKELEDVFELAKIGIDSKNTIRQLENELADLKSYVKNQDKTMACEITDYLKEKYIKDDNPPCSVRFTPDSHTQEFIDVLNGKEIEKKILEDQKIIGIGRKFGKGRK